MPDLKDIILDHYQGVARKARKVLDGDVTTVSHAMKMVQVVEAQKNAFE